MNKITVGPGDSKTIMIVDDSAAIRYLVGITLRGAGYRVIEAADGLEALDKLRTRQVHLVISDLHMPNMDGIKLLQELRQTPDHRFTPCIILTTDDGGERRAEAQVAGAKAWIVKPFSAKRLLCAVAKLVSSSPVGDACQPDSP